MLPWKLTNSRSSAPIMNERRIERIQHLIKARVAQVIDSELADPRRGMVTVTKVEVDSELSRCLVYWSILGDEKARRLNQKMLDHAASFVQREVAAILTTRTVPRLRFVFDESIEKAIRMDGLLDEIRKEREAREAPEAPSAEGEA